LQPLADLNYSFLESRIRPVGHAEGSMGAIIQALRSLLQIALPPLLKPGRTPLQSGAKLNNALPGQTTTDGLLSPKYFIFQRASPPGYLADGYSGENLHDPLAVRNNKKLYDPLAVISITIRLRFAGNGKET